MAQIITFLKIIQDGILPDHKTESITTTNLLFRLHTKYTSTTFIIVGTLLFIQQLFIDHLKCFRPSAEGTVLESAVLNQYCYTAGTYSVRNIDTLQNLNADTHDEKKAYYFHQYFQWVPFILLIQGMACHIPQLIWNKFIENGRLAAFCKKVVELDEANNSASEIIKKQESSPLTSTNKTDADIQSLSEEKGTQVDIIPITTNSFIFTENSFAKTLKSNTNRNYFYSFMLLEILNTVILVINFITTDWFVKGYFAQLGPQWVHYVDNLRGQILTPGDESEVHNYLKRQESKNPLEMAFPTLFNCHWDKPGTNGSVSYTLNCVMSLNSIHQKIYLVFWFGFIILFCMGCVNFIYRLVLYSSPTLRRNVVNKEAIKKCIRNRDELKTVLLKMDVYDWFILDKILRNVDPQRFYSILQEVIHTFESRELTGNSKRFSKSDKNIVGIELTEIVAK